MSVPFRRINEIAPQFATFDLNYYYYQNIIAQGISVDAKAIACTYDIRLIL